MRTISTINMPKTADDGQSNTWDFPIHQEELLTSAGIRSGIHAVVRGDTGTVIGQYRGEKAIPYSAHVATFERAASEIGLRFERKLFTTHNGSRFFGEYKLQDSMAIRGEMFTPTVRLQSSHDGLLKRGWTVETLRLLCLNGMMGLAPVFAIGEKHSVSLKNRVEGESERDFTFVRDNLLNSIEQGAKHTADVIEKMQAIQLDTTRVRNIISNIVQMGATKGVSPKAGLFIHNNWQLPSADERGLGNTIYRLYNAATRYCRDVNNAGRFEQSRRANLFITGALALAVNNPGNLERLLNAPKEHLEYDSTIVNS